MNQEHPLYHFMEFNQQIYKTYDEIGILNLDQKEFEGKNSVSFFSDILRSKKNLHPLPFSYFKLHDELNFISKDLKYITGVLHYLLPFIVDTEYTGGRYPQNLPDHRYLTYANFGYQSIYNFWDRIGDLLHIYFETGLPMENVYLGRVLSNMKDPYNANPSHVLINPIYLKMKDIYDNELRSFFEERNTTVHHFQLEAKYYWGNIELHKDRAASLKLNREKHAIPNFIRKHLDLLFIGFELALKLIDALPDKLLVFIKREFLSETEFKIHSIKIFNGEDITQRFDLNKAYLNADVEKNIAEYKQVNQKLIVLADDNN